MTQSSQVTEQRNMRWMTQLQFLRGIAAVMVVFHHVFRSSVPEMQPFAVTDFGRPGVLIFFVLSGFVMMHSCRNETPADFLTRRIIRMVPLYWIMTGVMAAIILRGTLSSGQSFDRVPELIQSLLFIPHYHAQVTDKIWPILVPGWTLNYEMFFYIVFFIGVLLRRPGPVATVILAVLVLLGLVIDSGNAIVITWTSPFLLLFLAGMAAATLWDRIDLRPAAVLLPFGVVAVVLGAVKLLSADWNTPVMIAGCVMTFFGVLGVQSLWPSIRAGWLALIGDASYSIYLSHTIILVPVLAILKKVPVSGSPKVALVLIVAPTVCTVLGILIYKYLEKPMIDALKSWTGSRRKAPIRTATDG